MKKGLLLLISVVLVLGLITGCTQQAPKDSDSSANSEPASAPAKPEPVTLVVATAGDTNMKELQRDAVGKEFSQANPQVSITVVGTGPGDAGSQTIFQKLKAQKDAGKTERDIDVAIVHQSIMNEMMKEGLLEKYVPMSANKDYVTSADSKNSLGTDVTGYVIPMFHSHVVLAYNPEKVKDVPQDFDELIKWIKANPKRFGYNGIQNGMSGVAFTTA